MNAMGRHTLGLVRLPLIAGIAAMAVGWHQPAAADEPEEGFTVVHLVQKAERTLRRDRLRAQLRLEAVGSDQRKVQADINRGMTAALERAKSVSGLKIETLGYFVYEEQQGNVPSRWRGSQGMSITGGDFAAVLAMAGDLQGMGLTMQGLSFELAPETARSIEDELTSEALRRVRERAERIAGDLQLTVVRLRDVRVGNVDGNQPHPPVPMRMRAVTLGDAAPAPPPAAEGGDQTVEISVEVEAVLEPAEHGQP